MVFIISVKDLSNSVLIDNIIQHFKDNELYFFILSKIIVEKKNENFPLHFPTLSSNSLHLLPSSPAPPPNLKQSTQTDVKEHGCQVSAAAQRRSDQSVDVA